MITKACVGKVYAIDEEQRVRDHKVDSECGEVSASEPWRAPSHPCKRHKAKLSIRQNGYTGTSRIMSSCICLGVVVCCTRNDLLCCVTSY